MMPVNGDRFSYQVEEHFAEEVSEEGVVLPLLDVGLEEVLSVFCCQLHQHNVLDILCKLIFEVLVQVLGLVQLIANLQHDSIAIGRISIKENVNFEGNTTKATW
jgi:hypothetical protein